MMNYDYILENNNNDSLSKERLIKMYNSAVEEIHFLQFKNNELRNEIEMLEKAYDEVSFELYG